MPCIICEKEAPITERIPLEDLPPSERRRYEREYFVNWEYCYVCRGCYGSDLVGRGLSGGLSWISGLVLSGLIAVVSAVAAYGCCLKYGVRGARADTISTIFAFCASLFLFPLLRKIFKTALVLLVVLGAGALMLAYSDVLTFVPDLDAATKKFKQEYGMEEASTRSVRRGDVTTRVKVDPLEESRRRKAEARRRRAIRYLRTLRDMLPYDFGRMNVRRIRHAAWLGLEALALLYALWLLLRLLSLIWCNLTG